MSFYLLINYRLNSASSRSCMFFPRVSVSAPGEGSRVNDLVRCGAAGELRPAVQ